MSRQPKKKPPELLPAPQIIEAQLDGVRTAQRAAELLRHLARGPCGDHSTKAVSAEEQVPLLFPGVMGNHGFYHAVSKV